MLGSDGLVLLAVQHDCFSRVVASDGAITLATSGSHGVAGAGRLLRHACDRTVVETSFDVRTRLPARV